MRSCLDHSLNILTNWKVQGDGEFSREKKVDVIVPSGF